MLDPILGLAVSMHSGKGVYALLLGSGVSRSSAIPPGWEVIVDLIQKLAHLKGDKCGEDPEGWYKALTGTEPDYSDILDQLTTSSAERAQLLRSYFEQTPDDREQARKAPSPAHRAIATLVIRGYVKVIVTTNFDPLMEQALAEAGVQPTIISTVDALKGALPLTHSACTIIKVHGDYRDARIKNTRLELGQYEEPLNSLLDRVFDEFGLVVCGWSAEWDVALRAAIERCSTRRFGTYWTAYKGSLGPGALKLTAFRQATVISITDADSFFRDLAEKMTALEDFTLRDPISAAGAVVRTKRYLATPEQRINLYDLVNMETERVRLAISADGFSDNAATITPDSTLHHIHAYEAEMQILLPVLACGGHWAADYQYHVLHRSVKRLADDPGGRGSNIVGINLQRYPAMLAMYAIGLAAISNNNYGVLKQVFGLRIRTDQRSFAEPITEPLSPLRVLDRRFQQELLPGREREFTPLNNHIFEFLRGPLREYLPDDRAYEEAFDWFEYLLGLVHCDLTVTPHDLEKIKADPPIGHFWGPIGRFVWNRRESDDSILKRTQFDQDGPYPETVLAVLRAGMFGSSVDRLGYERFLLIKCGFDVLIGRVRGQMGVW